MASHCQFYNYKFQEVFLLFKIIKKNCCGLDVHKTWIFACIGITDSNDRTEYKQARFSSFSKGLQELCDWLAKYHCTDVCMESSGRYWIPVFNILEKKWNLIMLDSSSSEDTPMICSRALAVDSTVFCWLVRMLRNA